MNKDEALKMAIEALQNNQTYDWKGNPLTALDEANEKVINACKEALEQPAQKPLSDDDIFKIVSTIEQIKPQYGMMLSNEWNILDFARAIEQAHGIGIKNGQTI